MRQFGQCNWAWGNLVGLQARSLQDSPSSEIERCTQDRTSSHDHAPASNHTHVANTPKLANHYKTHLSKIRKQQHQQHTEKTSSAPHSWFLIPWLLELPSSSVRSVPGARSARPGWRRRPPHRCRRAKWWTSGEGKK